jgi:hypothetical protein
MNPAVFEQKNGYVRVTIWKNRKATLPDIAQAITLIDEGRIADFFDWAAQQGNNETVQQLKSEFIMGKTDSNFNERLKLLAKTLLP